MASEKEKKERILKLVSSVDEPEELPPEKNSNEIQWPKPRFGAKGEVLGPIMCIENVAVWLDHHKIGARFNDLTRRVEIEIPEIELHPERKNNDAYIFCKSVARTSGFINVDELGDIINLIASIENYHPVVEWIKGTPWDGESRLKKWYNTLRSPSAEKRVVKEMLMLKWAINAVALLMDNSNGKVAMQGMLVLNGPQYLGKSRWARALCGDPTWFGDQFVLNPDNKDSVADVVSHWIIEVGEIGATFKRSETDAIKAFLTRTVDEIRRPYDKMPSRYKRRATFIGTVNDALFLTDTTGNRRYWVIEVEDLDHEFDFDVQQLWAEIYEDHYLKGEQFWLTKEELYTLNTNNENHRLVSPVEELVPLVTPGDVPMSATEILQELMGRTPTQKEASEMKTRLKARRDIKFIASTSRFLVKKVR